MQKKNEEILLYKSTSAHETHASMLNSDDTMIGETFAYKHTQVGEDNESDHLSFFEA